MTRTEWEQGLFRLVTKAMDAGTKEYPFAYQRIEVHNRLYREFVELYRAGLREDDTKDAQDRS